MVTTIALSRAFACEGPGSIVTARSSQLCLEKYLYGDFINAARTDMEGRLNTDALRGQDSIYQEASSSMDQVLG